MDVSSSVWVVILTSVVTLGGQQRPDSRSLEYYESILDRHPDLLEARFGAGWAAYKKDDFERALSEFESVLASDDPDLRAKSFYNLGNSLYRKGRVEESNRAYRRALELSPVDRDAKYNYELTRRQLENRENSENGSKDQDSDQEAQGKEQDGDDQRQGAPGNLGDRDEREKGPEETMEPEESNTGDRRPYSESILNALKSDEKNLLKRRLDTGRSAKREKDW